MKTLNLYVTKNLLIVFMAAICVMTFIMMAGQLIKILELLSSGMSLTSFIKIFMLALPEVLAFALPISMLMAVTLVFSKMSSENEITALRASGISLWQITSPGLVLSVIISIFCLYLQLYMIPHCKFNLKNAKNNLAMENPSAVLTAGASIDMNGAFITVGDRKGDQLYRVSITKPSITGKTERIYGERGTIEVDESGQMLTLELEGEVVLRIIEKEDGKPIKVSTIRQNNFQFPLNIGEVMNRKNLFKKRKYLDYNGLLGRIQVMSERGQDTEVNKLMFQLNKALVMALSPFAFLMIAMPFGFRSARSESSIGLLVSLVVTMVYFTFVLLMKSFDDKSGAHMLVWIPNLCYVIYGMWAMKRLTKT